MGYGAVFIFNIVLSCTCKGAMWTCSIASCAISLVSVMSHAMQSMGSLVVSQSSSILAPMTLKLVQWSASVPLLIFVLGHVTQVRQNFVLGGMILELFSVSLWYVAEVEIVLRKRLVYFGFATGVHAIVMLFILGVSFYFGELHTRGNVAVLNSKLVKILGIFTVFSWAVFPMMLLSFLFGVITKHTYVLLCFLFDAFAKIVFLAILNAIQAEGESQKMAAIVRKLRSGNKLQTQFLRFVYHEIRNPFNTIMLGLNHLEEEVLLLPYKELIIMLRKAACSMLQVVDNVVDLTQVHGLELVKQTLNVKEIVLSSISAHSRLAQVKSIDVVDHISKIFPQRLVGDAAKLRKIFECLISNALKFSPNSTSIKVSLAIVDFSPGICKMVFFSQGLWAWDLKSASTVAFQAICNSATR